MDATAGTVYKEVLDFGSERCEPVRHQRERCGNANARHRRRQAKVLKGVGSQPNPRSENLLPVLGCSAEATALASMCNSALGIVVPRVDSLAVSWEFSLRVDRDVVQHKAVVACRKRRNAAQRVSVCKLPAPCDPMKPETDNARAQRNDCTIQQRTGSSAKAAGNHGLTAYRRPQRDAQRCTFAALFKWVFASPIRCHSNSL